MKATGPRRVIIDTDPGVDDALAILLALRSPEIEVVAITTVCGNVPVGQATKNLFRILNLVKVPPELLIGQGAARPLRQPLINATNVHGADGLGGLDCFRNPDGSPLYPDASLPATLPTAQDVWRDCVRRYPEELTLITLGPLTNLAVALKVDPTTVGRLRGVISMGGAIAVPGNISPAAEFNIYVDPHAAQRVIQARLPEHGQAGGPMTLVPLDVTTKVSLNRTALQRLTAKSTDPVCRFAGHTTGSALAFAEEIEGHGLFHLHDPLAVAVAIDPSLVTLTPLHVEVETEGQATRGMTLADRRSLQAEHKAVPNLHVALAVDAARVLSLVRGRLCRK